MTGHEPLIAMRMGGRLPTSVWLHAEPCPLADWPLYGNTPDLALQPGDVPSRLDLRCLVNVPLVWVHGTNRKTVAELVAAAVKAGAKRVMGAVVEGGKTAVMTDTEGAFEWHS